MNTETQAIRKGLVGVVADATAVSKVNAETNSLLYRGYPVHELAAKCSFEEVAYLLWNGELPDEAQFAEFTLRERTFRGLDQDIREIIDALPVAAHPMDVCRSDTPTSTPIILASRITGWTAHIMKQLRDNSLIRPLSAYDGQEERHVGE